MSNKDRKWSIGCFAIGSVFLIALAVGAFFMTRQIVIGMRENSQASIQVNTAKMLSENVTADMKSTSNVTTQAIAQNSTETVNNTTTQSTTTSQATTQAKKVKKSTLNSLADEKVTVNKMVVNRDGNGDYIYEIQKDDTLSYISSIVGFSVDEIAKYNHIQNVDLIYEGSVLRIPKKDN